ncbi:Ras GTPase activating protein [Trichuris trichiura]|uniref:Ras GTPase activating protein n=1 Tax=Trichuris trichiura TaxID=36087 RepID=A0A077Z7J6_TRITR|nr:Ras GTPase activating protein [Trichuris trichiura]
MEYANCLAIAGRGRWESLYALLLLLLVTSAPAAGDWYGCANKVRNSRSHDSLLVGPSQSTLAEGTSLVRTVDLSKPGCSVVPVHASLLGTPHCYRVKSVGSDGSVLSSKYFACKTACERDRWIANLSRSMQPNRDQSKRLENSLQVWILEAKGVLTKRRYLCELSLDGQVQARTSSKLNANICFWGEQFVFTNLASLNGITIGLYRESERKKRKENRTSLIGHVDIPVNSLCSKYPVEKWYVICGHDKSASKGGGGGEAISLRVKARFQSVTVLPLKVYVRLLQFLTENYLQLCLVLEPVLSVRAKEDFATSLVRIMHSQHLAKNFLCDLIMAEIEGLENDHLMFRGNSLATKAVEAYIKLIGEQYLHRTLASFVRTIQSSDEDCEVGASDCLTLAVEFSISQVDPEKLSNRALIDKHQEALLTVVHSAWGRILNSFHDFPLELRLLFHEVRKRLADCGRGELADNLISSSVFLRFLCPAIMSPSLFNLIQEYPCGRTARNLTLVAKTVQTLANFNKFGGKEHYMEFMNRFVEGEWEHMRQFLRRISSPLCSSGLQSRNAAEWNGVIDLGKDLSLLHGFLAEVLPDANAKKRSWSMLPTLNSIVEEIGSAYCREELSMLSSRSMDESNDSTTEGEKSRSYCLSTESSTSGESAGKPSTRNDEDCPWYTIIDENIGLRRMGLLVQQSRLSKHPDGYRQSADCSSACLQSRPQEAITASQLISGNSSSDIRFVDDASATGTEYHRTSTNSGEVFRAQRGLDGSEVSQASLCQTTVATSDYNSLSNSTNSPVGSTCSCSGGSSTADRRPNHSDSTVDFDESPVASSSQTHIPMAVSNPLYSLQQVPAMPCRSRDEAVGAIAHSDLISKRTPLICGGDSTEAAGRPSAQVDAHSIGKPLLPRTNPRFNGASFQHARAMSLSIPGVGGPLTRPPSIQNSTSHDSTTAQASSSNEPNADPFHRSSLVRELRELKQKLELSESRLQMAEQRERNWKQMYDERIPVWSEQVRPVFNRLREVEEELQQEINASIQKQMIIEKQRERIHSLVAANERLLSMFQQKDNCQELMALTENLANALTPPESDDGGSQQRAVNKWDDATALSNGMTNLGINGNGDGGNADKCADDLLQADFSQLKTTQC